MPVMKDIVSLHHEEIYLREQIILIDCVYQMARKPDFGAPSTVNRIRMNYCHV